MIALAAMLAAVVGAPAASAGTFRDADARVFTLQWQDDRIGADLGRLRPLPDGGVLFTADRSGPNLWRLHLDGRLERVSWAGRVVALAVEPAGTALVIRQGRTRIERLQLDSRRRATVGDASRAPGVALRSIRRGAYLAALGDGSIAVSDAAKIWRLTPGGRFRRLPSRGYVAGLAPMPGGELLVIAGARATIRSGPRWGAVARPWDDSLSGGMAVTADGVVVTTTASPAPALAELHASGAVSRHEWSDAATMGDGDGVGLAGLRWPTPPSMAVTTDGSLLFSTGRRIRAIVPADSPRPRLAFTQGTYESLLHGRVDYHATGAGELRLVLRRKGETVMTAAGEATGGDGTLALPRPPSPGVYDVRLRLTSGPAVSEARARVDLREILPLDEAAGAAAAETSNDGDEGGGAGTRVGPCERQAPLVVRCVLLFFETGNDIHEGGDASYVTEVPSALAWAQLERDGGFRTWREELAERPEPPGLRLDVPRRQRFASDGIRARVTVTADARVTVGGLVRVPGELDEIAFLDVSGELTRQLSAGERWEVVLPVSAREARRIRRWLARGHRVIARLRVEAETDARLAPARHVQTRGSRLIPAGRR